MYHLLLDFMPAISCLLRRNMPPLNWPIVGPPTPLSLFSTAFFDLATFSRMIPFSLASCLLFASFSVALLMMPFRCDIGIFSCFNMDVFDPNACSRISSSFCRWLAATLLLGSRRCDSLISRCRARSFFKLSFSAPSSSSSSLSCVFVDDVFTLLMGTFVLYSHRQQLEFDHHALNELTMNAFISALDSSGAVIVPTSTTCTLGAACSSSSDNPSQSSSSSASSSSSFPMASSCIVFFPSVGKGLNFASNARRKMSCRSAALSSPVCVLAADGFAARVAARFLLPKVVVDIVITEMLVAVA